MRHTAIAALLAVLVALAGCSAAPSGTSTVDTTANIDGTASAQDGTATTAPASTTATATTETKSTTTSTEWPATTTSTGVDGTVDSLPPGVNETGLANESALWRAHLDAAYAGTYEHEVVLADDAGNRSVIELAASENATTARAAFRGNGSAVFAWFADRGDVSASWNASSPARSYHDHAGLQSIGPAYLVSIAEAYPNVLLRAGEFAYDGTTTHDGETVVRLRATGLHADADGQSRAISYLPHERYESMSGTVLVTPDGFVAAMDLELAPAGGGPTLDAEMTATRTADAVARPDWIGSVPDLSLSVVERDQYDQPLVVAVENDGGGTVSAGATLSFGATATEYGNVTLDSSLAPGETAYLYLAGDATYDGNLGVSIGDPPSLSDDAPTFGPESSLVLTVVDGTLTANYGLAENESASMQFPTATRTG